MEVGSANNYNLGSTHMAALTSVHRKVKDGGFSLQFQVSV